MNNAGVIHPAAPLEDIDEKGFDRVLSINAKSIYLTARHLVPLLKTQRAGCIAL